MDIKQRCEKLYLDVVSMNASQDDVENFVKEEINRKPQDAFVPFLLAQNIRLRTCYEAAIGELRFLANDGPKVDWNAVLLPNLEIAERIYDLADSYAQGWEARGKADALESDASTLRAADTSEK